MFTVMSVYAQNILFLNSPTHCDVIVKKLILSFSCFLSPLNRFLIFFIYLPKALNLGYKIGQIKNREPEV